jgi:hypothetical protein
LALLYGNSSMRTQLTFRAVAILDASVPALEHPVTRAVRLAAAATLRCPLVETNSVGPL